jgi:hypothetical protein
MNIRSSLVSHAQSAELIEPGMSPFDDPSVAAKSVFGLNAPTGDPRFDAASSATAATTRVVIPFVSMQYVGATAGTPPAHSDRRHAIKRSIQNLRVMDVGWGQQHRQRNTLSIDKRWRFEPGLPLSVGFGPVCSPLFLPPLWRNRWQRDSSRSPRLVPTL